MLIIGENRTKETAIHRRYFYDDADGLQVKPEPGEEHPDAPSGGKAGIVEVWFRPLTGGDERDIQDGMVTVDTKGGTAKMHTGTSTMLRILRSIVVIEGLGTTDDKPIKSFTKKTYDNSPTWLINAMGDDIDEINNDRDPDAKKKKSE